jgi:hypothetical protein
VRGYSLLDILAALAILSIVLAIATPQLSGSVERSRLRGAAYYLSGRAALLRTHAVHRTRHLGLRFQFDGTRYVTQTFEDGDGDGVRTADIASGRDRPIDEPEYLGDRFDGVTFGFVPGCPFVDGSAVPLGVPPVRLGAADMLVFAPSGSATSGTLYLRGRGHVAYAVVVLGATGRTRIQRCDGWEGRWSSP